MFKLRTSIAVIEAIVIAVVMAGCSNDTPSVKEIPSEYFPDVVLFDEGYLNEGDGMKVFIGGSGSCPPVIEGGKIEDDTVTLTIAELPANTICTADYVMYGFDVKFSEPIGMLRAVEVIEQRKTRTLSKLG